MTLVKHIHTYKHSIMAFIIQRKQSSYQNMYVNTHMYDLLLITSLHYHHVNTYASMHVHILMLRHAWHHFSLREVRLVTGLGRQE